MSLDGAKLLAVCLLGFYVGFNIVGDAFWRKIIGYISIISAAMSILFLLGHFGGWALLLMLSPIITTNIPFPEKLKPSKEERDAADRQIAYEQANNSTSIGEFVGCIGKTVFIAAGIAAVLAVIYFLVRFVKWSWNSQ